MASSLKYPSFIITDNVFAHVFKKEQKNVTRINFKKINKLNGLLGIQP